MLFLALRHLFSRKRQTVLILLGISLATMIYVVISGLQLGMRDYIINRLMDNSPQITISAADRTINAKEMTERFFSRNDSVHWIVPPAGKREEAHIEYPEGWFERLRQDPNVIAYAPSLHISVIVSRGTSRYPATLTGIEPEKQVRVTQLEKYMVHGSLQELIGGGDKLIVGDGMLTRLGVRVGDVIQVSAGTGSARPFKIVGALHLGVKQVDDTLMFASLGDVQQLNRTPGRISEIDVRLVDLNMARTLADRWKLYARDNVESWDEKNANFLQVFTIQDISRNMITIAILIVAGFGIYNVLSIMISQKRREIAILRSIGYPPRKILELFLTQGILLGISGAAIGLLTGYLANLYIGTIKIGFNMGAGNHMLVSYAPSIYVVGFLLAIVSAVLASFLPARAASKLTPLEIIRSEV